MSLLVALDSKVCTVGMRVQDSWGACGTVAWVGKLDKNPPPPNNGPTKATYAGVLFDIPIAATSKWRCDGTLHGVTLVPNALPGQVGYIQPKNLFKEVVPTGLAALRTHYGPRIGHLEDEFLEKFLIARRFEMPAVIKMLDDHLKWLEEYKPRLDEYFPPDMAKGYPTGGQAPPATDYEGNLIRILRPGNLGAVMPKDFVGKWTIPLIMRWHATDMLQWTQDLRNTQWRSRRYCVIIDLKDLGDCDSNVLSFAKGLNAMDQANFPENVYRMCIVNAPSFFAMVWRLVRALVDERTKEKIQIFSVSDTKKGALLEFLAKENLPTALGGTNDSFLRNGGVVGSLNPAQAVDMAKVAMAGPMPDVNDPDVQAALAGGSEASPITAKSPAVGTPASP